MKVERMESRSALTSFAPIFHECAIRALKLFSARFASYVNLCCGEMKTKCKYEVLSVLLPCSASTLLGSKFLNLAKIGRASCRERV